MVGDGVGRITGSGVGTGFGALDGKKHAYCSGEMIGEGSYYTASAISGHSKIKNIALVMLLKG